MAKIFPFQPYRYTLKAGSLSDVVTQPYDKITPAMQARYQAQSPYNLVYREEEREMMPLCREEGIGVIPWSPLARGFLAGNRKRGC